MFDNFLLFFSQTNKVFALSIANIFSGIFGGVPTTAALARTSLNIRSGATGKLAGMINAIGVLTISLALLFVFEYLLLASIAAILICVAFRMVEIEPILHMYHCDKGKLALCLFTATVSVIIGPTEGIIAGMIIGLLLFADKASSGHGEAIISRGDVVIGRPTSLLSLDENEEVKN